MTLRDACLLGCYAPGTEPEALRLRGGVTNSTGRLEVCRDGEWGTFCRDVFSDQMAAVACRYGTVFYDTAGTESHCCCTRLRAATATGTAAVAADATFLPPAPSERLPSRACRRRRQMGYQTGYLLPVSWTRTRRGELRWERMREGGEVCSCRRVAMMGRVA
jgi:hypothetical protein